MALKTYLLDYGDAFNTLEDQASLLSDALASGKPEAVTGALRIIAKARGMTETAAAAGLSREAVYRATGPDGNPTLATLLAILNSAGLLLSVTPGRQRKLRKPLKKRAA
jgi:probable addiction module antidote protein